MMQEATKTERSNRRAFVFVLSTVAIDGFGSGLIFPVFPLLLLELTREGVQRAAIYGGWLAALFSIVQFFAAPMLGNLSDRYGRRPILLGSLTAFGINSFVTGLAPSIGWLFVGASLAGAFSATLSAANAYAADTSTSGDRARKFGMIFAAWGAGFTLGPMVVGLLEEHGTRMPFFVAAGLALLTVVYGLFMLPESLRIENRRPFSISRANPLGTFVQMCNQKLVLRPLVALGLMQISAITVPVILGYFTILKFGWSQGEIGIALSAYATATVIVQGVLMSRMNRLLGHLRTACLGFSCMTIGLLGYAFAAQGWIMMAFTVPLALGSITGAALISHMSRHVSADSQGELQGAAASTGSAAAVLAPPLMTELFSRFSANDAVIYFPGAPYLMAAVFACSGLLLAINALRWDPSKRPNCSSTIGSPRNRL